MSRSSRSSVPSSFTTASSFTIASPVDVLALVDYGLGFRPEGSLVLVALTEGGTSFQARVDLPAGDRPSRAGLRSAVDPIVAAARRNHARRAFVVAYSSEAAAAERVTRFAEERLRAEGIETLGALRVDGDRWFRPRRGSDATADGKEIGECFDLGSHPLLLQAAYDGRPPLGSREALLRSVAPDAGLVAEAEEALRRRAGRTTWARQAPLTEAAWVQGLVSRFVPGGAATLSSDEIARLLVAVAVAEVRDELWLSVGRATAATHVAFWTEVVRRAPRGRLAAPAAMLGFAAWQLGNGALAWCAVDRCLDDDPACALGLLVAAALETATPPHAWTPVVPPGARRAQTRGA